MAGKEKPDRNTDRQCFLDGKWYCIFETEPFHIPKHPIVYVCYGCVIDLVKEQITKKVQTNENQVHSRTGRGDYRSG